MYFFMFLCDGIANTFLGANPAPSSRAPSRGQE
jgi:hypothetical protein